jgi:hypothetical protein
LQRYLFKKNSLLWATFMGFFGKKSTSQSHSVSVDKSKVSVFWLKKKLKQNSNAKETRPV